MRTLLIIILLVSSIVLNAQKAPFKFGKLDKEEIGISQCDFYPEAHSMILGMYGNLNFMYDDHNNRFKFRMEVLVRKKIFKKTDLDAGTFKIKYYEPVNSSSKEEISGLKAITYNLVDGKTKETKLDNSGKFDTRINDNWKEITVTMPEVQEGSVIEYTYTISSPFLATLKPWHFQTDIPVKYSEFRVLLPEYYFYQVNNTGAVIPLEHEETVKTESFSYTYKAATGNIRIGPSTTTERVTISSLSKYKRFIARDVKPIIDEPFVNNKVDLPNRVEFQLITIKFPQEPIQSVAESYEKFNKEMIQNDNFGGKLNKGNFAKDFISTLKDKDDIEKASAIFNWLRTHFTWDGYPGFTSKIAGRPAFNQAKGDAGDINLTFIAALRQAGLDAHPVILSTRGHGAIHPVYPSFDDFNYVVAYVRIKDGYFMADATSNMPFGMLPERCLNGTGWISRADGGEWVEMKGQGEYGITTFIITSIQEGNIISDISVSQKEYAAADLWEEWKSKGEDKYQEKIQGSFAEWDMQNYKTEKVSILEGLKYNFSISRELESEDMIYLNPLLYGSITANPFKREERISTIDFPCEKSQRVICQIQLPEGYTAELPEPGIIKLPDNAGQFLYNVSQIGSTISITSDFRLRKKDFTPKEYQYLKQFYQLMIEKNQSLIVIKKS